MHAINHIQAKPGIWCWAVMFRFLTVSGKAEEMYSTKIET